MTPATDLSPEKQFLRGPAFVLLGLGLLAMYLNAMPTGIVGAACLLLPLALIAEPLGDRIPILKDYLGGAPLLLIFLGASIVHFKILSPQVVESFGGFMKESGSNFLDFFICSLITGAIFGIPSTLLLKCGLRYGAPVVGGVVVGCSLLALVGILLGQGWEKLVLNIGFPIFGGGIGAGAVPMSKPKAIEGTLSVMVGGKQEIFDRCVPVFKAMAASVVRVGDVGAGNVTKLANQVVVALNIAALSEAMVLAAKAGVEPELVYQAIRGGLAGSTVMDAKAPLMLDRKFNPGFRINLHIKDLANALDTSHEVGAPHPLTASVMEIMQALKLDDFGDSDHGAIVRYFEKQAKIELKRSVPS